MHDWTGLDLGSKYFHRFGFRFKPGHGLVIFWIEKSRRVWIWSSNRNSNLTLLIFIIVANLLDKLTKNPIQIQIWSIYNYLDSHLRLAWIWIHFISWIGLDFGSKFIFIDLDLDSL